MNSVHKKNPKNHPFNLLQEAFAGDIQSGEQMYDSK
jgi:hypothetical protein